MVDTNALFRAWLVQNERLSQLAIGGIVCGSLLEGCDPSKTPAITFFDRGGNAHSEIPIVTPSLQVTCWAGDLRTARELYGELFDYVHGKTKVDLGEIGHVISCLVQVSGQDVTDPDTGWATVVSYFELVARSN